jgi:hypothetical protein
MLITSSLITIIIAIISDSRDESNLRSISYLVRNAEAEAVISNLFLTMAKVHSLYADGAKEQVY